MIAMKYDKLLQNSRENEFFYNYTHCELHPSMMFGVLVAAIPFSERNQAPRNIYQGAMGKQAMGIYATNYNNRMDTIGHILYYPQVPLVSTKASKYLNIDELPSGQNPIVAILCYTGYNQEDSLIFNQSSIDKGLFISSFYRKYQSDEKRNHSALEGEKFCKPEQYHPNGKQQTSGMKNFKQNAYDKLDENGFVIENSKVEGGDVIIGKVIPIKSQNNADVKYKDSSTTIRANETGTVDKVYVDKNGDGYQFCKVRVRSERRPVIGDKFSARHGQKGTIGITYQQQDMPFTKDGITPDLIVNPHAIPSRMTVGQLLECLLGKTGTVKGFEGDGTPFTKLNVDEVADILQNQCNYERYGTETLYNGKTGEQIKAMIFMGPTYYQRLKHMVEDKIHSRATGPIQSLSRQSTEGRSRDGGLRLGEMERDCLISHGTSQFLKERMYDMSDKYTFYVCNKDKCGQIAVANPSRNIFYCTFCDNKTDFAKVDVPYASKLMLQEIQAINIKTKLIVED